MVNHFQGRTIQIAGSCSNKTDLGLNKFSHQLIKSVTQNLLENGAIILTTVGEEPKANEDDENSPLIIYYWDILESAFDYARLNCFDIRTKNLIKVVSSEKSIEKIPEVRKELWYTLIDNRVISVISIKPGWNAGAYMRQKEEENSDALIMLGGGEGVEHLANLYVSNGKPAIPLDIPLGSSHDDGLGGSVLLHRRALADQKKFHLISKTPSHSSFAGLTYKRWMTDSKKYADNIIDLLNSIISPKIFYVRLMNDDNDHYADVEHFFRSIVDPLVIKMGYCPKEIGLTDREYAFINTEIFSELNHSSIVIADLTDARPNCFMEMGYAFGKNKKVLLTAKKGTDIPFDPKAIPCYFWDNEILERKNIELFKKYWKTNINRPPLVPTEDIF